jgi:hypothetical protein
MYKRVPYRTVPYQAYKYLQAIPYQIRRSDFAHDFYRTSMKKRQRLGGCRCQKGRCRLGRHPRKPKTHRYHWPTSRTPAILGYVHQNTTHTSHTIGHRPTLRNATPTFVDHPRGRKAMHARLHSPLQTTQTKQRRHLTHTQLPQRMHNNPQIHLRPTI